MSSLRHPVDLDRIVDQDLGRFVPGFLNSLPFRSTLVSPRLRRWVYQALAGSTSDDGQSFEYFATAPDAACEVFRARCREVGINDTKPWKDAKVLISLSFDIDSAWSIETGTMAKTGEMLSSLSMPATFFVVGDDYKHDHGLYRAMREMGHEIGLHGLHHNYRDPFLSSEVISTRLDRLSDFIETHGIQGYRSPCYLKSHQLMEALVGRFAYDSSFRSGAKSVWTSDGVEGIGLCVPFAYRGLHCLPCTGPDDLEIRDVIEGRDGIVDTLFRSALSTADKAGVHTQVLHLERHSGSGDVVSILKEMTDRLSCEVDFRFVTCAEAVREARQLGLLLGDSAP